MRSKNRAAVPDEARVLGLAVLEHVEIIGAVVNARAEQKYVGRLVGAADEFAHESRGQIGLVVKFGRKEAVKCAFVQWFFSRNLRIGQYSNQSGRSFAELSKTPKPGSKSRRDV